MKKLASLLLCLCCLCAVALGEGRTAYDFGDFTLEVPADALVYEGERVSNAEFFAAYPDYDDADAVHPSMSIIWTETGFAASFAAVEAGDFAQAQLDGVVAAYGAQGATVAEAIVQEAGYSEDGSTLAMRTRMTVDYAAMGMDVQLTLCQAQVWMDVGAAGGYLFSFTAGDEATLDTLLSWMDTLAPAS